MVGMEVTGYLPAWGPAGFWFGRVGRTGTRKNGWQRRMGLGCNDGRGRPQWFLLLLLLFFPVKNKKRSNYITDVLRERVIRFIGL